MKRTTCGFLVLIGLLAIGLMGRALASGAVRGDDPAMKVSPDVLVLAKVQSITVHTNIPYSAVELGSLSLNEASPTFTKADNRGHLVARFLVADVEGLAPGKVTLVMTGALTDGTVFTISDTIRVK